MPPLAHIVHQTRCRVRLRIAEKRKDPDYFEEVGEQLETVSGILEFRTNSATGCIILQHPEQTWPELEPQLEQLGLFEISGTPETGKPAMESLATGLSRVDKAVTAGSGGRVDLKTLAYLGLMAITISQAMRGQLLGPAIPLLFTAMSLVDRLTSPATDISTDPDSSE